MEESWMFDDMNGEFDARLRKLSTSTRSTRSGDKEIIVTNHIAVVEAKFSFGTLDRLYYPSFIAIEREIGKGYSYLIFEVVSVNPIHFQMLGMDISMPTTLRREYLDTINEGWGKSQETWIELVAIPTWHMMESDDESVGFERSRFLPLVGAKVFLLSRRAVEEFLCFERGETLGSMIGFELPLTINLGNLIRYHSGVFGFSGAGKSNLTSLLIRKAIKSDDITVVIFDIAGEYAIHLMDLVESHGRILSQEPIENEEQLLNSQVLPESLEESVSDKEIQKAFSRILEKGLIHKLALSDNSSSLELSTIESLLEKTAEEGKTGSVVARITLGDFRNKFYNELELQPNTKLHELGEKETQELTLLLDSLRDKSHEKSSLRSEVEALIEYIDVRKQGAREDLLKGITPERLALELVREKAPRLNILYLPDPINARSTAHKFITRLLYLKKKEGSRKRILIVLDEAQEYIPDNLREKDQTLYSNYAVEALLRQGRKYRVHCWLATQRVAHLNVSALQQLHSYFVSTLPRFYDRMVVAETFALPYEVLERSAQLDTGEWIFVSFKATKQKNVPVFVKTENNETIVARYLKGEGQG
jgi:DNA helicase HerA-like ATPase